MGISQLPNVDIFNKKSETNLLTIVCFPGTFIFFQMWG